MKTISSTLLMDLYDVMVETKAPREDRFKVLPYLAQTEHIKEVPLTKDIEECLDVYLNRHWDDQDFKQELADLLSKYEADALCQVTPEFLANLMYQPLSEIVSKH